MGFYGFHLSARSLADLEEEVFVEKAKQDKADKEAKARFVDVDIGPVFTHWRRRNALDLIKSTSKKVRSRPAGHLDAPRVPRHRCSPTSPFLGVKPSVLSAAL